MRLLFVFVFLLVLCSCGENFEPKETEIYKKGDLNVDSNSSNQILQQNYSINLADSNQSENENIPTEGFIQISSGYLNFRKSPGISDYNKHERKYRKILNGTKVKIIAKTNKCESIDGHYNCWYEIKHLGKSGFIFGQYLTLKPTTDNYNKEESTSTVGDWFHEVSKNMGGYNITSKTKLTIIRIDAGIYEYKIATTVIDEMYGGNPKTNYSSGKLEKHIKDNKWVFSGGDFGERGGYISIPSAEWDDYKPKKLSVLFASGRGSSMNFNRTISKSKSGNSGSGNGSEISSSPSSSEETSIKAYRQGYSDGKTGYGLPAYERVSAYEFYMSRGYNYSKADYYVYEMGYNDGVYGRNKKY